MSSKVTIGSETAPAMGLSNKGLQVETLAEMQEWANQVIDSGLAPKGFSKPSQVILACQYGMELGFSLARSLSVITVVNGRAGIMGDAAKALIRRAGVLKPGTDFEEYFDGDGEGRKAVCKTYRAGVEQPFVTEFSVKDAQRAGLWGRSGPWSQYPGRMMAYRALGFHVRDFYSDVTLGLYTTEELNDFPVEAPSPGEIDVSPIPAEEVVNTEDPLMAEFKQLAQEDEIPDAEIAEPEHNAATDGEDAFADPQESLL